MKKRLLLLATLATFSSMAFADITVEGAETLPTLSDGTTTPTTTDTLILTGATITTDTSGSTTTNFKIGTGASTITVSEGFTLNMESIKGYADVSGTGSLTVSGAGTVTYSGIDLSGVTGKTLTLNTGAMASGQTINLGTGNSFVWNGTAELLIVKEIKSAGSNITIRTLKGYSHTVVDIDGGLVDISSGNCFVLSGTIKNLKAGSSINYIGIEGGKTLTIGEEMESLDYGNGSIAMWSGAELVLKASNLFQKGTTTQKDLLVIQSAGAATTTKITLEADNAIKELNANRNANGSVTTTIDLNGHTFHTESIRVTNASTATLYLIIEDFVNGAFSSKTRYDVSKITAFNALDEEHATAENKYTDLTWVEDKNNAGVYFLYSATAVPEPAQWAMIFGAIALMFVAYRRRK